MEAPTIPYYVGVDIGGTNVRTVIANEERLLLKISSDTIRNGPPEALATQIIKMIERCMKELGIKPEELKGIGTSSAGPFVGGESLKSPNICGVDNDWNVIPYLQVLKEHFGPKMTYSLENDCVSSVKAEYLFGAGQGHHNCVYITISTGVGTGIVSDDILIEGKGKNAGHFGHIIVKKDGDQCGCGQRGCIEALISGRNITRRAQEAGLKIKGKSEYNTKDVFDAYKAKDPIAMKIIQETIEYMAIFFINIINVTDTEILIVGGSVFMNNIDVLLPAVQNYISEHSMAVLSEGVQFKPPELGEYVGDLAGLCLVIPQDWIKKWIQSKPWAIGIKKEMKVPTKEILGLK